MKEKVWGGSRGEGEEEDMGSGEAADESREGRGCGERPLRITTTVMSLIWRSARRLSHCIRHLSSSSSASRHRPVQTVLGIETSCDDTAAAILDTEGRILSDVCISQMREHLHNGGVIPPIAMQLHAANIDRVIVEALRQANMSMRDVDYIAVTNRPGMPLSLQIGVDFAKRLAIKYGKPLIPIHHMEAHALIGMLSDPSLKFPFLVLLLSGGHAQIAFVKGVEEMFLLGTSLDDAPGETFDKIARRLKLRNLGYPFNEISGGEAIEIMARTGDASKFFNTNSFIPLQKQRNCDFSFSGFKNFLLLIRRLEAKNQTEADLPVAEAADVAASLQYLVAFHIFKRLTRAVNFVEQTRIYQMQSHEITAENMRTMLADHTMEDSLENGLHLKIVLSGGVGCSDYFASCLSRFCSTYSGYRDSTKLSCVIPRPKKLCSDNGIMIAWNAVLKLREVRDDDERHERQGRPPLQQQHQSYHASQDVNETRSTAHPSSRDPDPGAAAAADADAAAFTPAATYDPAAEIEPESRIMLREVSMRSQNESEREKDPDQRKELCEAETAAAATDASNAFSTDFHHRMFILQSRQEIESLVPVPKISLGTSLREVVAAADIKPAVINRSIFPSCKNSRDVSCDANSTPETEGKGIPFGNQIAKQGK